MKSPLRGECRRRPPYLSIYLSIYLRGWAHESRPASLHSKGRRRRAEGISLRRGAPLRRSAPKCRVAFSPPAPPSWAYGGNVCAARRVIEARRPRSYGENRPLRRPLPGKRRESPLTAGGGARNISPCAADGRKRRGGAARDAPGTLKTGYRGITDRNACGAPAGQGCRRRSPTRDQFHKGPYPGSRTIIPMAFSLF